MSSNFKKFAFKFSSYFPPSFQIFCFEPQNKRIFPPIGARGWFFRRILAEIGFQRVIKREKSCAKTEKSAKTNTKISRKTLKQYLKKEKTYYKLFL
ncbi:hypothetical protein BXU10_02955 [Flavobacterium sp. LM4]|nr:hypothetical protein BXU10_02955 [Flavobacterium sp. LM4]